MKWPWAFVPFLVGCGLVIDLERGASTASDGGRPSDASESPDSGDASMRRDAGDTGDAAVPGACGVPVYVATAPVASATTTTGPSLVWTGDGFGLVWHAEVLDLGVRRVFYARLGSDGLPIGVPTAVTGTTANGDHPVLEWNGAKLALAWEDSSAGDSRISLAHLATDGTTTDGPFTVSSSPTQADRPAIAWNGSAYGLSWEDTRDGHYRIYFRAIAADGTLGATEVAVSPMGLEAHESRVAWSGEAFLVAWHHVDAEGGNHVGISSPPGGTFVAFGPGNDDPDVAWTGSGWAIAYELENDLAVAHLDPVIGVGTTLGSTISTMPNDDDEASVAWNGSELGIAFEASNGAQVDIHFVGVDGTGEITRPVRVVDDLPSRSQNPSLAWAPEAGRYGVAWSESVPTGELAQDIYFAWICP